MFKRAIFLTILAKIVVAEQNLSNIDSLNLKYMYEGAKEIEMLNRSMEAGMREHNIRQQPIVVVTKESLVDNSPMDTFQDLGNRYLLEKEISGENPKVKTSVANDTLKVEITTSKRESIVTENGVGQSSLSVTTTEEIPIPFDADISLLKKELKGGLLRVEIPKKRK